MQFLYPQFLFALFALAIPVVIHLFHFRKYKKAVFSDIRFLKLLQEQTKSNRRLKDLLILICRLIAISALVFAFAQPFLKANDSNRMHGNLAVSLFLDNSISMLAIGERGPLFEEAKQKSIAMLEALPEGTHIQLVSHHKSFGNNRSLSIKEAIGHIVSLEPVTANRTPEQIVAIQQSWFEKFPSADHHIYWVSDFQKSSHQNISSVFRDTSLVCKFIPLSSVALTNISIDSAWTETPFFSTGEKVKLFVRVSNYGTKPIEDLPVTLSVNGVKKGMMAATLDAQSGAVLSFDFIPETVFNSCKIELTDYPISFDDIFYLQLTASDKNNVMCINGGAANKYIDALLDQNDKVVYRKVNELGMDYDAIGMQSLIILNELTTYSSGLAQMLVAYVNEGGSLFIIPPADEKHMATLNKFLVNFKTIQFAEKQKLSLRISDIDLRNPLFDGVFAKIPNNADMPLVNEYYRPQIQAVANGSALLKLNNGDALIWQNKLGKGNIQLIAQPIDERWGNLPAHALFVPLMINLSRGVAVKQQLYFTTGSQLNIALHSGISLMGDKTVSLKSEKEAFVAPVRLTNSGYRITLDKDWMLIGFYDILQTGTNTKIDAVAFNHSKIESDPETYSIEQLNEMISQLTSGSKVYTEQTELLKYTLQREQNGEPLWRLFVIIAVLALLAEIALIKLLK